jgi:hypothetical protein
MLMSLCRSSIQFGDSHRSGAVYQVTPHFPLQIENRMKSKSVNNIEVLRREKVDPSGFQSGNALHIICLLIPPSCLSMHHRRYLSNQARISPPSSSTSTIYFLHGPPLSRPSILYLAGGALNQQRHKQCFLALTWHPALPCHCLFANDEIIGCGVRINHETKPDVRLCLHTSSP